MTGGPRITLAALAGAFAAMVLVEAASARPDTRQLSCAQAQDLVNERGAITLSTGDFTFARFVSGTAQCRPLGVARPEYAPTRDNRNCRLFTCRGRSSSDGSR
ncbi:MAG: hypothetical protein AAGF45_08615 [Pseudomonadota bacterium]